MHVSERFEIVVVGGGVVGAATAEVLAGRGRRVALVERRSPAHDHGSSHGDGRIIRYSYPEAVYIAMAQRVYQAWSELETRVGETLVETTGGWECGPAGSQQLADLEASFRAHGIDYERWDPEETARRRPQLRLPPGSLALYQADSGIVRAERAVRALWRQAEIEGAAIRSGARVTGIDGGDQGVTLSLEHGQVLEAESVVLTVGGWAQGLLAALDLDVPLDVTREAVSYFPVASGQTLDHGIGALPTVIDYHEPERPFYCLPKIDVPGVKIGWHHSGPVVDPDDPVDREASARITQHISDFVRERFPALDPTPLETVHCLYTNTSDYHFILDRHPSLDRVVIGAGFSGHGFKFGPVVGEILADLAEGEEPGFDLATFRLDRFGGHLDRRTSA